MSCVALRRTFDIVRIPPLGVRTDLKLCDKLLGVWGA